MAISRNTFFYRGLILSAAFTLSGNLAADSAAQAARRIAAPGASVTIYAAGDIADCREVKPERSGAAQTAALIGAGLAKEPGAAVLTLGDNTYPVGLPLEFANCYQPTWGRFKARTYPTPGNHDYYTPQAVGYYGYFGASAGPAQRGYYSFDLGKWHLIALNSNLKAAEHDTQLAWLKADLDLHKTHCTLAFWHHPLYSSGGHGDNEYMQDVWQALQRADADLVLVGHDHDYERFAPQDSQGQRDDAHGLRQFVVGTGGARLTGFRLHKPNSQARDHSTHGVLKLVLQETGYTWEFLPAAGGSFGDRGAAACH